MYRWQSASHEHAMGQIQPSTSSPVLHQCVQKCKLFGCPEKVLHLCSATSHIFGFHFGPPSCVSPHHIQIWWPYHHITAHKTIISTTHSYIDMKHST
jgi:hypothetical protein